MSHQIMEFIGRHWELVGAFVLVLVLLLVEEARSHGSAGGFVSATELTHLINRDQAIVIDVRDNRVYRDGHIIGAVNIPEGDLAKGAGKLEKYKKQQLVLVDALGNKTAALMGRLKKSGDVDDVKVLKGGMSAWKSAEMPIVKENSKSKLKKAKKSNG